MDIDLTVPDPQYWTVAYYGRYAARWYYSTATDNGKWWETVKRGAITHGDSTNHKVSTQDISWTPLRLSRRATKDGPIYEVWLTKRKGSSSRAGSSKSEVILPELGKGIEGAEDEEAVMKHARDYWSWISRHKTPTSEILGETINKGDALLDSAGTWFRGVCALRRAWMESNGSHLEGIFNERWNDLIDKSLLNYLREQTRHGAKVRYQGPTERHRCKMHSSAAEFAK
jgi:hypothetical protein